MVPDQSLSATGATVYGPIVRIMLSGIFGEAGWSFRSFATTKSRFVVVLADGEPRYASCGEVDHDRK